jgi:hypothetical protein
LWLTPEFCSLDWAVGTTEAVLEHTHVEEEAIAFRNITLSQLV